MVKEGPSTTTKELKEAFVTGFDGTSPQELLLVCSTSPIGTLFYHSLCLLLLPPATRTTTKSPSPACTTTSWRRKWQWLLLVPLVCEIFAFWMPMILCQSQYLYPYGVFYLSAEVGVSLLIILPIQFSTKNGQKRQQQRQRASKDIVKIRREALTMYRSSLMWMTFVAILAVDFRLFPRRHVKTEIQGYSLMDVGAASFVFAAGLVSSRARRSRQRGGGSSSSSSSSASGMMMMKSLKRSLPLVTMGYLRLATHKGIEYQEHVSEYGVHWNFFFTMALLSLLTSEVVFPGGRCPTWTIPAAILLTYQIALSRYGIQEWVQDAPRTCTSSSSLLLSSSDHNLCHLFVANREGILGSVGYFALYLLSEWMGRTCLWVAPGGGGDSSSAPPHKKPLVGSSLWGLAAIWGTAWKVLESGFGIPASRRTTNATFILWVLALNTILLASIMDVTLLFLVFHCDTTTNTSSSRPEQQQQQQQLLLPPIFNKVNRHGLVVFVAANLMTGIVNLSISTMEVSNFVAFGILFLYLFAIGTFASLFDWFSLRYLHQRQGATKPHAD